MIIVFSHLYDSFIVSGHINEVNLITLVITILSRDKEVVHYSYIPVIDIHTYSIIFSKILTSRTEVNVNVVNPSQLIFSVFPETPSGYFANVKDDMIYTVLTREDLNYCFRMIVFSSSSVIFLKTEDHLSVKNFEKNTVRIQMKS